MSQKILGNSSLAKFDVLVIGAGAGGGTLAGLLALKGLKVLVLEAGPNVTPGLDNPDATKLSSLGSNDEIKLRNRFFIDPDPLVDPRTFRQKPSDGDRKFTGDVNFLPKCVGGGALHADLKTPRYQIDDFHLGTLIGAKYTDATFADWPVDYPMLEPFYTWIEYALGVQGLAGSSPTEAARSKPYPMPPGVGMYAGLRLAEAATKLGYHPHPYPAAVNSQPYGGRPACNDCGFCSEYACPINAKSTPSVSVLRQGLLTGNMQIQSETRVRRLNLTGTKITSVDAFAPDGSKVSFTADRYVLAASAIESARLLLLSDPGGKGLGNSSGMVGRNLMFHYQTVCVGVFAERMHAYRGRAVSHGMTDFRGSATDASKPLGGIIEFGGAEAVLSQAMSTAPASGIGAMFKKFLRQGVMTDRLLAMTLQAEDAPQATNCVDLDPAVRDLDGLPVARITYSNHAFELAARAAYAPKMLDIMMAAGAKHGFVAPPDDIPGTAHVLGTLRMGTDPKTSVCDATGKLHDIDNLYASDGSLFPTSSGFNPTLTIAALAARVAGGMLYPGSPEKALT